MNDASQGNLRKLGKAARAALSADQRASFSARIVHNLCSTGIFRSARSIACYVSLAPEADTSAFFSRAWKMQKRIFAPVIMRDRQLLFREIKPGSTLARDAFGLWQPVQGDVLDARSFDLVIVPVVAFDARRNRIGMGGGYYDRAFSFLKNRSRALPPHLVGIAFECQKVPEIKANPWDVAMQRIVTEVK